MLTKCLICGLVNEFEEKRDNIRRCPNILCLKELRFNKLSYEANFTQSGVSHTYIHYWSNYKTLCDGVMKDGQVSYRELFPLQYALGGMVNNIT